MSLNNLAQAGLKMLQSTTQTEQMRQDLERVNMEAIRREGLWVTNCEEEFVATVCEELKAFLDMPRGLSALSHWLNNIVRRVFDAALRNIDVSEDDTGGDESNQGDDSAERNQARRTRVVHSTARNLLRDWTYYSVQMMRELTVKNAPSFGTFTSTHGPHRQRGVMTLGFGFNAVPAATA